MNNTKSPINQAKDTLVLLDNQLERSQDKYENLQREIHLLKIDRKAIRKEIKQLGKQKKQKQKRKQPRLIFNTIVSFIDLSFEILCHITIWTLIFISGLFIGSYLFS